MVPIFNKIIKKWVVEQKIIIAGVCITMTGLGDTVEEAQKDLDNKLQEARAKA